VKKASALIISAAARNSTSFANTPSKSRSVPAFRTWTSSPSVRAADSTSLSWLCRQGRRRTTGNNYSSQPMDQIGHHRRQSIELVISPTVFNRYILAFD
jgi:hypothetical protein